MNKKGFLAAAAAVLCAALLCACGAQGAAAGSEVVHLCEVTHSVFYAPQYAAMQLGYFDDEHIALELTNGGGADKVMSAVLSGDIDIGFAGPEASVYVYNEGQTDYMQVFAQVTQRDGSFLVARQPNNDFSWNDLRGAHVLPGRKGGVPYMALEHVIKSAGLDVEKDLLLDTSIQFDLMAGAFTGGTGDYVTLFEPVASSMEANGQGYIVASVGEAAGEIPYTAYFARKSYLAEHHDLVLCFTRALYKGQQWVQSHSAEEIAALIAGSFPDTDAALLTSAIQHYKDIDAYAPDPLLEEEAFNRLQAVMQEAGELAQPAPYADLVNTEFATAVLAE